VEQRHWLPTFQVHHHRPIALALPMGPVIDPNGRERPDRGERQTAHQPQQRVPTGGQSEAMRKPGTRLSTEGHANRLQGRDQPMGLARLGSHELGHTFREDAARAGRNPADEFAHEEPNPDGEWAPGQVHQVALVAAMHRR